MSGNYVYKLEVRKAIKIEVLKKLVQITKKP